jgi:nucleoid-associated protein YgaU
MVGGVGGERLAPRHDRRVPRRDRLSPPATRARLARNLPLGIRRLVELAVVASCLSVPALPAYAAHPASGFVVDQPVVRAPHALALPSPPASTRVSAPHFTTAPASTVAPKSTTAPPSTKRLAPAPTPASSAPVVVEPSAHARSGSLPRSEDAPAAPTSGDTGPAAQRVVVRAGDNLWVIARTALFDASHTQPDDHDVARYWTLVIAVNRSTLRSGDPSLIFPGEVVTLPPVPAVS